MIWRALLLVPLLLAACGDRRSFDQRYQDTSSALVNEAQELDANLAADNLPAVENHDSAVPENR